MKKTALATLLAMSLVPAASFAQVVIRVGPPAPVMERPGPPPQRGFVWVGGYQEYVGNHYVWHPGHWDRPPHPGARWIAPHYARHGGGYTFVRGYWR